MKYNACMHSSIRMCYSSFIGGVPSPAVSPAILQQDLHDTEAQDPNRGRVSSKSYTAVHVLLTHEPSPFRHENFAVAHRPPSKGELAATKQGCAHLVEARVQVMDVMRLGRRGQRREAHAGGDRGMEPQWELVTAMPRNVGGYLGGSHGLSGL